MFQEAVRNNVSIHTQAVDLNFGKEFDFSEAPIMESVPTEPAKAGVDEQSEVILGLKFEGVSGDKDKILAIHHSLPDGQNHEKILVVGRSAARLAWACAYKRPYSTVYFFDKEAAMPLIPDRTHGQLMRLDRIPELYPGSCDRIVCLSECDEVIKPWFQDRTINPSCKLMTCCRRDELVGAFAQWGRIEQCDGGVYEVAFGRWRIEIGEHYVSPNIPVTEAVGVPPE
jgi:hypothetical protein